MARLVSGVYQERHGAGAILVSQTLFNQELLEQLRSSAWNKSREDKSRSYMQWLDLLCGEYGFVYTSLKTHIEALEVAELLTAEDAMWKERLAKSRVWGTLVSPPEVTLPIPVEDEFHVPWPSCFVESRLFSLSEKVPRRTLTGPVYRMDGKTMLFEGEELRICHDQTLLMVLLMVSGKKPCGALIECSLQAFETTLGSSLAEAGMALHDIERTLWRLSNCRLIFEEYGFDGPLLVYADAGSVPAHFKFAFNPAFAHFYYPILKLFSRMQK